MGLSWEGWKRYKIPDVWRQNYPARDMRYIYPRPADIPAAITWAVFLYRTREQTRDDVTVYVN